jgi:hypothetical protein
VTLSGATAISIAEIVIVAVVTSTEGIETEGIETEGIETEAIETEAIETSIGEIAETVTAGRIVAGPGAGTMTAVHTTVTSISPIASAATLAALIDETCPSDPVGGILTA